MSELKKNKYNRTGPGANQSVFGSLVTDTGIQEDVNTVKKKKATFEMDPNLHRELRRFAVEHDTTMVTIVEKALKEYFRQR
ncbi:hypothetical protein SAMN05421676_105103 [Salinibacillus kushneri]|uniref:ParG protein n=1 Tax=Salinibacillus kushneri TaxID=237682 RepID=A0A1I0EW46_9BACI|nr:hypothetical protein [Salinibacillus kushneri]SET49710.1 hypothetical protein SAMN05421676_105103 [Salinibacillus kushneri]